ncbi:hypothetical protein HPB48_002585 [Haemaphysalis longicornis]|uniref:Transmembrane protein n=1 Tax=Haemaphysalis longicornis TaxID=44386 RepID=A0A9J6G282_HAELO|nr:hypothetical protein HPB48_002585 [Haemaphysalis longicornis]
MPAVSDLGQNGDVAANLSGLCSSDCTEGMASLLCSLLVRKLFTGRLLFWVQQQRYMYSVRRALERYKLERLNSWRRRCGLPPQYPLLYRLQRFVSRVLCASFCACCHRGRLDGADFQGGGRLLKSLQPNTFENRLLKSFVGFGVGALLTVLLSLTLARIYQQANFLVFLAVFACGTFLMLGSAFSGTVRCLVLLTLPQMFSREGRLALMAYVYFLVLTGPAENFAANVEVLSRGLSCGQEKVANETRHMLQAATSPLKAPRRQTVFTSKLRFSTGQKNSDGCWNGDPPKQASTESSDRRNNAKEWSMFLSMCHKSDSRPALLSLEEPYAAEFAPVALKFPKAVLTNLHKDDVPENPGFHDGPLHGGHESTCDRARGYVYCDLSAVNL